jgi:hypothetical protein
MDRVRRLFDRLAGAGLRRSVRLTTGRGAFRGPPSIHEREEL